MTESPDNTDEIEVLESNIEGGILRVLPLFTGKPHVSDIVQAIADATTHFGEIATIDSMQLKRPLPSNVELRITNRLEQSPNDERPLCTANLSTENGAFLSASFFSRASDGEPIRSFMPLREIEPEDASASHDPVSSVCTYETPNNSKDAIALIFRALNDATNRCMECSPGQCLENLKPGKHMNAFTRYGQIDIGAILQTDRFTVVSNLWKTERRNGYLFLTTSYVVYNESGERLCSGDIEKAIVPLSVLTDS